MRAQIERLLGLRALDIYGLSEIIGPGVAAESLDSDGMLNVAEDHFFVEAIDADGRPVPDGTPGELVFTTLTKTGMPLLRYRSRRRRDAGRAGAGRAAHAAAHVEAARAAPTTCWWCAG